MEKQLMILGLVAFLILCAVILIRYKRSGVPYAESHTSEESRLEALAQLPRSPLLRVSFHEALTTSAFASSIQPYYCEAIGSAMSGDGVNAVVQSIVLSSDKLELTYSFSDHAKRLYDAGKAFIPMHRETGRRLPLMMDMRGTIIEQAKETSFTSLRLAQATALIVSVAHIISGLDVVARLEDVDRKLSALLAYRKIDQDAKFMRLYVDAQSLLSEPLTRHSLRQLRTIRSDLLELRQVWRGEIASALQTARHPHQWQFKRTSTWFRGGREKKSVSDLAGIAERLQKLRLSVFMDASLAESIGTMDDFLGNSIREEYPFWIPLRGSIQGRADAFRKDDAKRYADTLSEAIAGYVALLEGLAGDRLSSDELLQLTTS